MTVEKQETGNFSCSDHGYHAHDLLWLKPDTLPGNQHLPAWVSTYWTADMPVVVRRDFSETGLIPVGIRGRKRSERAAAWVCPQDVIRKLSPEEIIDRFRETTVVPFSGMKPVQALQMLLKETWLGAWGVTGSCAFALATGMAVMHDESDLDLLIRCPHPLTKAHFVEVHDCLKKLPCRADIQIETPVGAFSLKEWLRDGTGKVLLKTDSGPFLTVTPWCPMAAERGIDG